MTIVNLEPFFTEPCFGLSKGDRHALFEPAMNRLHQWHLDHAPEYRRIMSSYGCDTGNFVALQDMAPLMARLFKHYMLRSVGETNVVKMLTSSGTSSQTLSKIALDVSTSGAQSKALVKILQSFLGKQRYPMLIIDSRQHLQSAGSLSARGAGIQGLSLFGRDHTWALTSDMRLDLDALERFALKYQNQPVIVFGFTFVIWQYLVQALERMGRSLCFDQGVLIHSGGWKKLRHMEVSKMEFNQRIKDVLGIDRVHNFYGMVEQTGSIFVTCEFGYFHSSLFSEVFIRDPLTMTLLPQGKSGLIQALSVLPESYPGHNLLTEDQGYIVGIDDCQCGRKGTYFEVVGRYLKSEVRGCSDTIHA